METEDQNKITVESKKTVPFCHSTRPGLNRDVGGSGMRSRYEQKGRHELQYARLVGDAKNKAQEASSQELLVRLSYTVGESIAVTRSAR